MSDPDPRNTPYDYCEAGPVINPIHQPNPAELDPNSPDALDQLKPDIFRRVDRLELTIGEINRRLESLERKVHLLETIAVTNP